MTASLGFWCLLILVQALSCLANELQTVVKAAWLQTPLRLEASEFFSDLSPDLFWRFVDAVDEAPDFNTDQDEYTYVMEMARGLIDSRQESLLQFSLALREFSPAVEMYRQLARDELGNATAPCGAGHAFVMVDGRALCDPDDLQKALDKLTVDTEGSPQPYLDVDHVRGARLSAYGPVVLYGRLGTRSLAGLHAVLKGFLGEHEGFGYALRHHDNEAGAGAGERLPVGGYGVELAVKDMEYKAVDDRKREAGGDDGSAWAGRTVWADEDPVDAVRMADLAAGDPEIEAIDAKKVKDMGLIVTGVVLKGLGGEGDVLRRLMYVTQNLPTLAKELAKLKVKKSVRKEATHNARIAEHHMGYTQGFPVSVLTVNGITHDANRIDSFTLSAQLRADTAIMRSLRRSGVPADLVQLMMHVKDPHFMTAGDRLQHKVLLDLRTPAVQYLNNLATDKATATWSTNLQEYLQRSFTFKKLRHNAITLVMPVHVLCPEARDVLAHARRMIQTGWPVRFGFLFYTDAVDKKAGDVDKAFLEADTGVAVLRVYSYILKTKNRRAALDWLASVYEAAGTGDITRKMMAEALPKAVKDAPDLYKIVLDADYDTVRTAGETHVRGAGLRRVKDPAMYINGERIPYRKHLFEHDLSEAVQTLQFQMARAVWMGQIRDIDTDVYDYFLTKDKAVKTFNPRIMDSTAFLGPVYPADDKSDGSPVADVLAGLSGQYFATEANAGGVHDVTVMVAVDLATKAGINLALAAMEYLSDEPEAGTRVALIGMVATGESPRSTDPDARTGVGLIRAALAVLGRDKAIKFATDYLNVLLASAEQDAVPHFESAARVVLTAHGTKDDEKKVLAAYTKELGKQLALEEQFTAASLIPTGPYVIAGGRLYGPLDPDEVWTGADIAAVVARARDFSRAVYALAASRMEMTSDALFGLTSCLGQQTEARGTKQYPLLGEATHIDILPTLPERDIPAHSIMLIVDPLTRTAQRLAPLLLAIQAVVPVHISLHLLPEAEAGEKALKRYYRLALHHTPRFTSDGRLVAPAAVFKGLPGNPLLTLGIDAPPAWDVMAEACAYDLDNLHPKDADNGLVRAEFALTHILVEGHMYDEHGEPPRGLQLNLGTSAMPHMHDTLVMANLGYFQLKGNPRLWRLYIRPGRSTELYTFGDGSTVQPVKLNKFSGVTVYAKAKKRPGKETEKLLDDKTVARGSEDNVINVFSLASGHLYERFMSIMMLSVRKNSSKKVKFWLFEPPMSPSFKHYLPHLAKEYGFEYQLVSYKWPKWLREQTEKQRIIWGYKILFLDVLFPLDVKRVIFVDADQTVRGDLWELMQMDLHGAPYGYTPFCSDRKDMDEFRFWKKGYWENHLQGLPYHISALYVIDLVRFRQLAAGDLLRQSYHQLSSDPGSLANLDQDLPNNLQHQLPIFSLPQEWLWCETWCSDKSKKKAKTIDLCNNPRTKEPKLAAAKRIVAEWTALDAEARAIQDKADQARATADKEKAHDEL